MTQELILTRGLPGSGKTTHALAWLAEDPANRVRVNRDDIRDRIYGPNYVKNQDREQRVTHYQGVDLEEALKAGKSAIVDDTNLNLKSVSNLKKIGDAHGAKFSTLDLPVSVEEAIRRNNARDRVVPEDEIRRMHNRYLGPNGEFQHIDGTYPVKPFRAPQQRTHAVGFDMDGSLADTRTVNRYLDMVSPKSKSKNFDAFHRNSLFVPPNWQVLQMLTDVHKAGMKVIITTARSEIYREVTQLWLDRLNVPYDNIFMRARSDVRPDYKIKIDLLKNQILPYYDVVRFVDDNPQAVQAWKDNNIRVTEVPGWDNPVPLTQNIQIDNVLSRGGCIRCGRTLKHGGVIGPGCAKLV